MFRKIVTAIIVVPLAAVIIAFAVANRETVTVSFDPFSRRPSLCGDAALFAVILLVLMSAAWWSRPAAGTKQRRRARELDGEVRTLRAELDAIRRRFRQQPAGATAHDLPGPPAAAHDPAAGG